MSYHESQRKCPRCKCELWRLNKKVTDKLINIIVPIGRYKCMGCLWEGVLLRNRTSSKVRVT